MGREICTLSNEGRLECWSSRDAMCAGAAPRDLAEGIVAITHNQDALCGLGGEGRIMCWERRRPVLSGASDTPSRVVQSGEAIAALAAPRGRLCVVSRDGVLRCAPMAQEGEWQWSVVASGVTAIAAEDARVCAVVDGAVECWAFEVGVRTARPAGRISVEGATFLDLDSASDYTCATDQLGRLYCFGANVETALVRRSFSDPAAIHHIQARGVDLLTEHPYLAVGPEGAVGEGEVVSFGVSESGLLWVTLADGRRLCNPTPGLMSELGECEMGVGLSENE